jgi:geranylgeranyl reductase family protein
MPERFDVIVVGGGPAGSTSAWRLSQSGAKVLVIDQKSFPRDKTCAGWVTPAVIDALQINLVEYQRNRVLQPITGFRTGIIGRAEIETRYDHVVSYGIRRCEFDSFLLNRCGAEVRTGQPVREVTRAGDCWRINDAFEAPILIGAGGHFCPVARMLGARDLPGSSVVTAQEIEFEPTPDSLSGITIEAETPELFFCDDLQGYGWCFKKGGFLNVGLGRVGAASLPEHVAGFLQFVRDRRKIAAGLPARLHGHAYQLYERVVPKLVDHGVLLAGDAAGLAHPKSGEGIRPAVESGLIAADVILGIRNHAPDALEVYAERIRTHFGPAGRNRSQEWLPNSWLQWAARKLLASRWFTRRVVLDSWFLGKTGA